MIIDFNAMTEETMHGMNNGMGKMSVKLFTDRLKSFHAKFTQVVQSFYIGTIQATT